MKIRKLEICGFKSFVDKTTLVFDHDVTGIVGPNGCGKSNVVDAMRWAMGEQSAQRLRGKSMEDVIFNGSETRPAHDFAEVSITFDNSAGLAPPEYRDYAEICVTRRVDRQGRSDFLINKTAVRLLDITNLFLGTGIGKRAYSIIEQGRIGYIVSSKPEDRRQIIEEAAGITKFKARKKAAERKIEQTRQNLLRVHDVQREIERSLSSLQRQAQKAERYKCYRAELRELELYIATHRWLEWSTQAQVTQVALREQQCERERFEQELALHEAKLEAHLTALQQLQLTLEQSQQDAHAHHQKVQGIEAQQSEKRERLRALGEGAVSLRRESEALSGQQDAVRRESQALEEQLEHLTRQTQDADQALHEAQTHTDAHREQVCVHENRLRALNQERQSHRETGLRIDGQLQSLQRQQESHEEQRVQIEKEQEVLVQDHGQLRELSAQLDAQHRELQERQHSLKQDAELGSQQVNALKDKLKAAQTQMEQLRQRHTEKRSRLRSLETIHERFEGVGAGTRALMAKDTNNNDLSHQLHGLVIDRLSCDPQYAKALASVLGDAFQAIVSEDIHSAQQAVMYLSERRKGRASMVFRDTHTASLRPLTDVKSVHDPRVLGQLRDLVRVEPADQWLVDRLIADVCVVESCAQACALYLEHGYAVVALDGFYIDVTGKLTGGSGDPQGLHLLSMQREMRTLHAELGEEAEQLTCATETHKQLQETLNSEQARCETLRRELHASDIERVRAEKDLQRHAQSVTHNEEKQNGLSQRCEQARSFLATLDHKRQELQSQQVEHQSAYQQLERQHVDAEQALVQAREEQEKVQLRFTEAKVQASSLQQQLQNAQTTRERLLRSLTEVQESLARLSKDLHHSEEEQSQIATQLEQSKGDLDAAISASQQRDAHLEKSREDYHRCQEQSEPLQDKARTLRKQLEALQQTVTELQLKGNELAMHLDHLQQHTWERHRIALTSVLCDYHAQPLPSDASHQRVDELKRLIERMGEINLTAIEEYQEKAERHAFLDQQRSDLEEALKQLEDAIQKMNRESKERFEEAFHAIRTRFAEVYPRMFGGGKAELKLSDPSNMLETGVEIVAQPPGKKLGSLELMSGGEKALTAVSLVFAIFQYKPSPFCLLDEVDAPLDEANIGRFASAVRAMTAHSQFIVITHSKATMEHTDVLFGVTMEHPGISKLVSVELQRGQETDAQGTDEDQSAVA